MPYLVLGNDNSSTVAPSDFNVSTASLTAALTSSDTPSPKYSFGSATFNPFISVSY